MSNYRTIRARSVADRPTHTRKADEGSIRAMSILFEECRRSWACPRSMRIRGGVEIRSTYRSGMTWMHYSTEDPTYSSRMSSLSLFE